MNKWLWAIPVGLIVVTSVAVAILGRRDVNPDEIVYKTALAENVTVAESDALLALDSRRAAFDACFEAFSAGGDYELPEGVLRAREEEAALYLVVEERPGVTVSIGRGEGIEAAADSLGGDGYNAVRFRSELIGGWVYCADYVRGITFRDTYVKRLDAGLTGEEKALLAENAVENAVLVLMDADKAPSPAERSSSRYAVCARLARADGGTMTAVFDPKEKIFLGVAAE